VPVSILAVVRDEAVGALLHVLDNRAAALADHRAGVADLTAGLGVERRLVDDDSDAFAGTGRLDAVAVLDDRQISPSAVSVS
jgi:hypothetical protein